MNIITGSGCSNVAWDLYRSAVFACMRDLRSAGAFVCMANIIKAMPEYNQEILNSVLWAMAIAGELQ